MQGDIGDGGVTDDVRPIFNGHIDKVLDSKSGEELHIFEIDVNGQMIDVTALGDLKWDDETHWQWTPFDDLVEGAHHYVAQVMDANGLVGKPSTDENPANPDDTLGYDIYLDTTPPDQDVFIDQIIDDAGTVQGDIGDEGLTDDTIPVMHGHLNKGLDSKAQEELHIFDGENNDVTAQGDLQWIDETHWTWTPFADVAEGAHSYTAQVIDGNGGEGKASTNGAADNDGHTTGYDIFLDSLGPTQTVRILQAMDDVGPKVGDIGDGGLTDDAEPMLVGDVDAPLNPATGQALHIFDNGVDITNQGTVFWDDETHWHWSPTLAAQGDGEHSYTAQVIDANENTSEMSSNDDPVNPDDSLGYDVYLDSLPPAQDVFIDEIMDDTGPVQGDIGDEGITDDTIPVMHATCRIRWMRMPRKSSTSLTAKTTM